MDEKIIVMFSAPELNIECDIEIPTNISANELIYGLSNCYLRSENPTALLRGDTTIEEYHLYQGSRIIYSRRNRLR